MNDLLPLPMNQDLDALGVVVLSVKRGKSELEPRPVAWKPTAHDKEPPW